MWGGSIDLDHTEMSPSVPFDRSHKTEKSRYRDQIKAEFDHCCGYCGRGGLDLTLDHVLAHCRGGQDTRGNLIPACGRCNGAKGSRSVLDWYTPKLPYFSPRRLQRILHRCDDARIQDRRHRSGGFG